MYHLGELYDPAWIIATYGHRLAACDACQRPTHGIYPCRECLPQAVPDPAPVDVKYFWRCPICAAGMCDRDHPGDLLCGPCCLYYPEEVRAKTRKQARKIKAARARQAKYFGPKQSTLF